MSDVTGHREDRRARTSRIFGVVLIILAIVTVARFTYQEQQNAVFQTCVSELATTMIARSDAADRERLALRVLVGQLSKGDQADRNTIDRAAADYKEAVENGDALRSNSNGSLRPITDCVAN